MNDPVVERILNMMEQRGISQSQPFHLLRNIHISHCGNKHWTYAADPKSGRQQSDAFIYRVRTQV